MFALDATADVRRREEKQNMLTFAKSKVVRAVCGAEIIYSRNGCDTGRRSRADEERRSPPKSIEATRNTSKKRRTEMQEIHWLIVRIHPFSKSSGRV